MRDSLIIPRNLSFLSAALALAPPRVSWPGFKTLSFTSPVIPLLLLRTTPLHSIQSAGHTISVCFLCLFALPSHTSSTVRQKSESHLSIRSLPDFSNFADVPSSRLFSHEEICLIVAVPSCFSQLIVMLYTASEYVTAFNTIQALKCFNIFT